jgi:hypothetical protein
MPLLETLRKLWFRPVCLADGETLVWRAAASRQQGHHAVGGELTLTSERLIFTANRLEKAFLGWDWSAERDDIAGTGIAGRSLKGGPFTGGLLNRRLRVDLTDGTEERFVVDHPKRASERLAELLAS